MDNCILSRISLLFFGEEKIEYTSLFSIFFLMEGLNWIAILISTGVIFAIGAVWHGPIFGKLWMRIHHGEKGLSDTEMKKAMEGMWKIMLTEFVAGLLMVIGLACLIRAIPTMPGWQIALMTWFSFIVTTMTSTVIWGNDQKKWMCVKIAVSSIGRLLELIVAAYILTM
jgi:hypothetical protein